MGWIEHFIHPEYKNGLWDGEGRLFPWTDGWFVYGSQLQSQSQLQVQLDSFQHNIVTVEVEVEVQVEEDLLSGRKHLFTL